MRPKRDYSGFAGGGNLVSEQFRSVPTGGRLMGQIGGGAANSYRSGKKSMSVFSEARDQRMRSDQKVTGAADAVKARRERLAAERARRQEGGG